MMSERKKVLPEPLKEADTPLAFTFNTLAKKYYGAAARQFKDLDLERHYFVLNLISKHDRMTQQCLANCLGMDKASVVRMIDYLSEKGLVKRVVSPEDRREHRIVVTKKALHYIPTIVEGFTSINQEAFRDFSRQEKQQFREMVTRMLNNLSALPAEEYTLKYVKKNKRSDPAGG